MSKIASLKKKAADLEKKSPDKAIAVYVELIAEMEKQPDEIDVTFFNRLGDLLVKQNNVGEAVDYYERAVDHYVEGGFFNNAIALCNKILRSSPGRSTVYYKLGKISAHKGFKADAKQNFLEYADRMQKAGRMDEAFRALAEFADLCPDQTDIRLMLAEQLAKAGKKAEAVEQLQILHEQLVDEGAAGEAQAAADRMKAIDPTAEPRSGGGPKSSGKSGDLVFLDLNDTPKAKEMRRSIAMKRATQGLKIIALDDEPPPTAKPTPPPQPVKAPPTPAVKPAAAPTPPAAAKPTPPPPPPVAKPTPPPPPPAAQMEEPPVTSSLDPMGTGSLLGFESTSFGETNASLDQVAGLELEPTSLLGHEGAPPAAELPLEEGLDFIVPDGAEIPTSMPRVSTHMSLVEDSLALSSPMSPDMDLEPPLAMPAEPATESAPDSEPLQFVDAELDLTIPEPTPADMRASSHVPEKSLEMLQAVVDGDPEDWNSHRELAEALLESGDREAGIRELEVAMLGFERSGDLSSAMSVADEIVRIDPSSVKHHQKRVEYAYRTNDRAQLVESYLSLADALFRSGQVDKSRSIYQRVLELAPDDARAQAALSAMPVETPEPEPERKPGAAPKRPTVQKTPVKLDKAKPTPIGDDAFVNLGDWLRDDETPKDTRMVVREQEPTGNEEADFADMLRKFKQGVAENVEEEDYQSHYDLGVAYKEMGLVDEAIAEFQKALRGPENRVRTYEAIGQCFIEKGQNQMAATVLSRALDEKGMGDDQLVGVLYLLGRASEALGRGDEAMQYYQRVFVVDIQFQDVADRLNALENATR
jgi:tetratricopeptide (TPR) repeat protein